MPKWGLIFVIIIVAITTQAQDERRFTLWNKNAVAIEPWKNISIEVAEKIQFIPKSNTLELKYGEIFVAHEALNWLKYGAGMRISSFNLRNGDWLNENRVMLFFDLSKEIKAFDLCFTNRFEYRTFKELENYFRHKQMLELNFPSITSWGMRFYLAEESSFKMNGIGTHQARFYSGVTALQKEHFKMNIYYLLEKTKLVNYWLAADIVGLNLSFSI